MADKLPGLVAGLGQTHPEDHVIQSFLETVHDVFVRVFLGMDSFLYICLELFFEQAVDVPDLLLVLELLAVFR